MGLRKHLLVLRLQARQCIDVEETPVAKFAPCGAPESQTIVLPLEQRIQLIGVRFTSATTRSTAAAATCGCSSQRRTSCPSQDLFVPVSPLHRSPDQSLSMAAADAIASAINARSSESAPFRGASKELV